MPGITQEKPGFSLNERPGWGHQKASSEEEDLNLARGQTKFKLKSETKALRWSLLGTLVPISTGVGLGILYSGPKDDPAPALVLIGSGLVIGPSLGYFYGGRSGRGFGGTMIRLGIEMVVVTGALVTASSVKGGGGFGNPTAAVAGVIVLAVGQGFVLAHGIYDIAKVKSEVRKFNQSLEKTTLIIAPKYFSNLRAPGFEVRMTF